MNRRTRCEHLVGFTPESGRQSGHAGWSRCAITGHYRNAAPATQSPVGEGEQRRGGTSMPSVLAVSYTVAKNVSTWYCETTAGRCSSIYCGGATKRLNP